MLHVSYITYMTGYFFRANVGKYSMHIFHTWSIWAHESAHLINPSKKCQNQWARWWWNVGQEHSKPQTMFHDEKLEMYIHQTNVAIWPPEPSQAARQVCYFSLLLLWPPQNWRPGRVWCIYLYWILFDSIVISAKQASRSSSSHPRVLQTAD